MKLLLQVMNAYLCAKQGLVVQVTQGYIQLGFEKFQG